MDNSLSFPLSPQQLLDPSIMRFMETQNEMGVTDVSFNLKIFLFKNIPFQTRKLYDSIDFTILFAHTWQVRKGFQLYEPLHVRHNFFWSIGKKNVTFVVTFETKIQTYIIYFDTRNNIYILSTLPL